jgi:hypothetical protein
VANVDEINTVYPAWRVERKKEKDAKDGENKKHKQKQPGPQKNQIPDDGRPHIDEYA